ncbi:MAG: Do family serine endopeptidase [Sphingobacteriaceae bacterium]|nr:Do family serine endopeptidase [Sphingobacteriaceae bacterium]
MKKVGFLVLAAFVGGASAIGAYQLLETKTDGFSLAEKQNIFFANQPKISSAGSVDFVEAAAQVSPAVVHIKTTYGGKSNDNYSDSGSMQDLMEEFFGRGGFRGRGRRMPSMASGSGVILTDDGYIVTNNHVVENADKIEVILSNKRKVEATVVGTDPNTDLALIKVDEKGLPFVKMGNSDNVQVGEWVLAVGFPLDLNTTVTAGIVSAKARSIGIINRERGGVELFGNQNEEKKVQANSSIESFIQTDAAINPGNSGGALVNTNGELIGINSAIASQSGRNEGYGFAIPINLAKKILEDFKAFGKVKRGFIGVTFVALNSDAAENLKIKDINGLYVSTVVAGGGAESAGVKEGDIIKKVDGKEVFDGPDLQEKIGRMSPGDKVVLEVLRNGETKKFTVTLKGESENENTNIASGRAKSAGATLSKLGATFEPATSAQKAKYGAKNGVIVKEITPGKLFDNWDIPKGLLVTTVNGKPVNSQKDVENALKTSKNGQLSIAAVGANGYYNYSFGVD